MSPPPTWWRSRGTPRIANRLLRRVRDYAEVRADGLVTRELTRTALELYEVDELGLDRVMRGEPGQRLVEGEHRALREYIATA